MKKISQNKLKKFLESWSDLYGPDFKLLERNELEFLFEMEATGDARPSYLKRIHQALCSKKRATSLAAVDRVVIAHRDRSNPLRKNNDKALKEAIDDVLSS